MADIDVVPKRSSSALIWVLAALAVIALLFWLAFDWGATTSPNTIGAAWQPAEIETAANTTAVPLAVLPL